MRLKTPYGDFVWKEKLMNQTTLCYIEKDDAYLMLHRIKKKRDVNKDKWIGIGGHFEEGESPEECLLREALEETGLTLKKWQYRGIVTFYFREADSSTAKGSADPVADDSHVSTQPLCEYMHLFTATEYEGTLIDCNEGELVFVKKEDVLSLNLWEGDRIFFDLLMKNEPFFSLKLSYVGNRLESAALNGAPMELLDALDENGNRTGQTRERNLAHRYGTWHATAHVWIIRKGKDGRAQVLLQKRSRDKDSFPGCLDISSAGHIPAGGDALTSALRELREELGIEAEPEELLPIGRLKLISEQVFYGKPFLDRQFSSVYLYRKEIDEKQLLLQESEIESVCFMDYEECLSGILDGDSAFCIFPEEFLLLKEYL